MEALDDMFQPNWDEVQEWVDATNFPQLESPRKTRDAMFSMVKNEFPSIVQEDWEIRGEMSWMLGPVKVELNYE